MNSIKSTIVYVNADNAIATVADTAVFYVAIISSATPNATNDDHVADYSARVRVFVCVARACACA